MQVMALFVVVFLGFWLWDQHPAVVVLLGIGVVALGAFIYCRAVERKWMLEAMSSEEREAFLSQERLTLLTQRYGPINPVLLCPHCGTTGAVRSQSALRQTTSMTGNLAKVETVHSREVTQRFCDNCCTKWDV